MSPPHGQSSSTSNQPHFSPPSASVTPGHIAGVPTGPRHRCGLCLQSEPSVYFAYVLCLLRAHRPVRAHQCGGGRADEAPGRLQQGGRRGGGDGCRN